MEAQTALTHQDIIAGIVGDVAQALGDRPGETPLQRAVRINAATETIAAFQPSGPIEAMLAGHCVLFHEMIVDSVHDAMRGEEDAARRATRGAIVAMDKAFGSNLAALERRQAQRAETVPDIREPAAPDETDIADRVRRHLSQSPVRQSFGEARGPTEAPEVACQVGSETIRERDIGAPVPSANAPRDANPAACVVRMSGQDGDAGAANATRCAPYAGNRQARRHAMRHASPSKKLVAAD